MLLVVNVRRALVTRFGLLTHVIFHPRASIVTDSQTSSCIGALHSEAGNPRALKSFGDGRCECVDVFLRSWCSCRTSRGCAARNRASSRANLWNLQRKTSSIRHLVVANNSTTTASTRFPHHDRAIRFRREIPGVVSVANRPRCENEPGWF